tara:strand:+ start:1975 stop:2598 length:624 start_codon:yes stop_codon:yes gene_type:complete
MAYFPESKYEKKFTPGKFFIDKITRESYTGWYMKITNGKFFTGKEPEPNNRELEKVDLKKLALDQVKRVGLSLLTQLAKKAFDTKKGTIERYFSKNKINGKITEVDKKEYNSLQNNDIFDTGTLKWKVTGPAKDKEINGYSYLGAEKLNKQSTEELNKILPGLTEIIKDYSDLVFDEIVIDKVVTGKNNIKYFLVNTKTEEIVEIKS